MSFREELEGATANLLAWAKEKGLKWDATPDQREWRARIESHLTDPIKEPDMNKWRTELAFFVGIIPRLLPENAELAIPHFLDS